MAELKVNVKLTTKTSDWIKGAPLKTIIIKAPEKPVNIDYKKFRQWVKTEALKMYPDLQFHSFCY